MPLLSPTMHNVVHGQPLVPVRVQLVDVGHKLVPVFPVALALLGHCGGRGGARITLYSHPET